MVVKRNHTETFQSAADGGDVNPQPVHSSGRRDWSAFKRDLEELAAAINDPGTPTGPVWIKRRAIAVATRHHSLFDTVIHHIRRILEADYGWPRKHAPNNAGLSATPE